MEPLDPTPPQQPLLPETPPPGPFDPPSQPLLPEPEPPPVVIDPPQPPQIPSLP